MASLISPACPFQTPVSTILRVFRIDRVLRLVFKLASRYFQQFTTSVYGVLQRLRSTLRSNWARLSWALADTAFAVGSFAQGCLHPLFGALRHLISSLGSLILPSRTKVIDSEAQPLDQSVSVNNQSPLNLNLPDIPTSCLEAPSILWLLETSTDPEVFLAAASLVPQVEWPLDLDISDTLHQLYDIYTNCLDVQRHIVPSLKEKASACIMALSHLYCGRVLREHPGHGEFLVQGSRDYLVLERMWRQCASTDKAVLMTATQLSAPDGHSILWYPLQHLLPAGSDSVAERLSHALPYHFFTGKADEDIETLAIAVISKLLSSPSPPTQIIANCALLACIMVGVQFDKKDIVRIDKSSALPRLTEPLLQQFQQALWECDLGDLDSDSTGVARRPWQLLDVICRMLKLVPSYDRSLHTMQNLNVCKRIYSRVRSS
ncbi:uncharacterized protein EDB91DRAFT_1200036, partial [Suillus paluster]|uniref:uncharacterized protein n=1 Tax=Suillus paluster TaxID=48578 RepID=UPI001B873E91